MGMKELFESVIQAEESFARRELHRGRLPDTARRIAIHAAACSEDFLREFDENSPPGYESACKEGCSWCCRGIKVDVLAHEAIAIAEYKRATLTPEQFEEFRKKVADAADGVRDLSNAAFAEAQVPCPLLEEEHGQCSIYPLRPMRCRGHASINAQSCENAHKHPERDFDVPLLQIHRAVAGAATIGQPRGLQAIRVDHRAFELATALRVALDDPQAGERWARGELLFDAALRGVDKVDQHQQIRQLAESLNLQVPGDLDKFPDGFGALQMLAGNAGADTPTFLAPPDPERVRNRNSLKRERRARKGKR